jgi:hypothetical protein
MSRRNGEADGNHNDRQYFYADFPFAVHCGILSK